MNLSIVLADNVPYKASALSLPFTYKVIFDRRAIVVGPIRATVCLLTHCKNQEISAGYVRNIFNISKEEHLYEAGSFIKIDVDALEHEDGSNLIAGEYELAAKVAFSVKELDGVIRAKELRALAKFELA